MNETQISRLIRTPSLQQIPEDVTWVPKHKEFLYVKILLH